MVHVRYLITWAANFWLRKSLIIGVRYAVCRRQFLSLPDSKVERKLMDYQSHMFKFCPLVAETYVSAQVAHEMTALMQVM